MSENRRFSELVTQRIKVHVDAGMKEDDAVARAFHEVKALLAGDGTVVRISREMGFIYRDGVKHKTGVELEAAVKRLGGRVLPTFDDHESANDIRNVTGLVHNIVYDPSTTSIYGEVFPPRPRGTEDSPGFFTIELPGEDGRVYQTNIDLDHVAISENLVARGGRTASVLDMAEEETKPGEQPSEEEEEEEAGDAVDKKAFDAVTAERDHLKATLAEYEKKERDALVKAIRVKLTKDAAVDFDDISIDGLRKVVQIVDAVDASRARKGTFFTEHDGSKPYVHRGNVM